MFARQGRPLTEGRIFAAVSRDLDHDELPDIVVADYLNPPRILFNDSAHGFARVAPLTATPETATSAHDVAVADFDGDGLLDLFVVFNRVPSRILFADGKGGFRDSGRPIGRPEFSGTSATVADIDGDGDADVFVTYYKERARLYVNDGTGQMAESGQTFLAGVAAGDIDGDGDTDVLSFPEDGQATLWLNENGRLVPREPAALPVDGIGWIDLADMDGDGDLDAVVGGRALAGSLWENDGRGAFRRADARFNAASRVAIADIDGDGRKDVVVGASVWISRGGGRFEHVQTVDLALPIALLLADIDADGDPDLLGAALNRETGQAELRLFLNRSRRPDG